MLLNLGFFHTVHTLLKSNIWSHICVYLFPKFNSYNAQEKYQKNSKYLPRKFNHEILSRRTKKLVYLVVCKYSRVAGVNRQNKRVQIW